MAASDTGDEKPADLAMEDDVDEGEVTADESATRETGFGDDVEEGEERADIRPEDRMDTT
jgi:hypothetical protein